MKYVMALVVILFFAGIHNKAAAQFTEKVKKADTVDIDTNLISRIAINCPVLSGGRGGADGLLVINSSFDVNSMFGYNCDFPDVDFDSKTLLYISMCFIKNTPYRVRKYNGQIIFSVYVCKNASDKDKTTVSILIPKVDKDNGVFLDVNEVICKPKPVKNQNDTIK